MNIRLLENILMSDHEYWVFEKSHTSSFGEALNPSIFMAVIPISIQRFDNRNDIKLIDMEKLESVLLDGNVFLNENFTPFQSGQTLHNVVNAYPIICNATEFLIEALKVSSNKLWDYKELIDNLKENIKNTKT